MNKISRLAASVALALGLVSVAGCSPEPKSSESQVTQKETKQSAQQVTKELQSGIDLENMSTLASPANDFYMYVNGKWLDDVKIPADKSNYGSFTKLYDDAQENLKTII